jgi:hypothetical protein
MKDARKQQRKRSEKGDSVLEFSILLPFLMAIMAAIGFGSWLFWSQAIADAAAVDAIRESAVNRGDNTVALSTGYGEFASSTAYLGGGQTAGVIGSPGIELNPFQRMVAFIVTGGTSWDFGPLSGGYDFGGGGSTRVHLFYPGPPDPWE